MTAHPLAGEFSVEASVRRVRHYRYVEERLMRVMGGWIALTPELSAKLLLGRHVWECAQHADLWGRRLPELRSPVHRGEPPSAEFGECMDLLEQPVGPEETIERLVGVYQVLKPHLAATYEDHLRRTNPVYEPPTRVILERCLVEERRHIASGAVVLGHLLTTAPARTRAEVWERRLLEALTHAGGLGADGEAGRRAAPEPGGADVARDLVALDSAFDPAVMAPDLRAAVDAHGEALVAGDRARLEEHIVEPARTPLLAEYATLTPVETCEVVAVASIGAYRVVKLRLTGGAGALVLQMQWRLLPEGWRVVEAQRAPDAGAVGSL